MDTRFTLFALALTATSAAAAPTELPVVFIQPGTNLKVGAAESFAGRLRQAMQNDAVSVGMARDLVDVDITQGFRQIASAADNTSAIQGRFEGTVAKPGGVNLLASRDDRRYEPITRVRLGFYRRVEGQLVFVRDLDATLFSLEFSNPNLSTTAGDREVHALYLHDAKSLGAVYGVLGRVAVSAYEVRVLSTEQALATPAPNAAPTLAHGPFGLPLS